ncbi:MAG: SDR family NAD(P)-dependent oxidoreductase, partial [Lentimicrobiaceae bacterium]|nr:SDR family NAD(P)-dependent oxidoreductase [Lentimicrobiaceae bacterium]
MLLQEKTAFITGAARGIGKQIALTFAQHGANIVFTDLQENEIVKETIKEIESYGVKTLFLAYNAADYQATEAAVNKAFEVFPTIDILVNNAGITRDTLLMRMSESDWDLVMNVNVKSVFNHVKAIQPYFLKQRKGSIVNMGSVVGIS